MTHSTVLTWPWLGPEFFLLYLLVQSLSLFTSLSILLYSVTPLSVSSAGKKADSSAGKKDPTLVLARKIRL